MKRLILIVLTLCMVILTVDNTVLATYASIDNSYAENRKEEILRDYKDKLMAIEIDTSNNSVNSRSNNSKSKFDLKLEVQAETVSQLREVGYEAYDVNPQTFENVGITLKTDLTEAGLSDEGAYIIIMNEDSSIYPDAETSASFTHTYNGSTYTLRYMTVEFTDDPAFAKSSYVNVLNDNSRDVIMNCLDTVIGIYVGAIWEPLGTISSLLGVSISDFMVSQDAYLIYNAASTWTKEYTQVWNARYEYWSFGCYVEEVEAKSYLNGWYYDVSSGSVEDLYSNRESRYIRSDKYEDMEWRKNYAVIGYLNSWIQADVTGDVEYKYGDDVVIRHLNNV